MDNPKYRNCTFLFRSGHQIKHDFQAESTIGVQKYMSFSLTIPDVFLDATGTICLAVVVYSMS
jgi:hypothetical protein